MSKLLNQPIDISEDFCNTTDEYFFPGTLTEWDVHTRSGKLKWLKYGWDLDWAFGKIGLKLGRRGGKEIPQKDYKIDPEYAFSISFTDSHTIRLTFKASDYTPPTSPSLMLSETLNEDSSWPGYEDEECIEYKNDDASIRIYKASGQFEVLKPDGSILVKSIGLSDTYSQLHQKFIPFSFKRKASDYTKAFAASFSLDYDEKIYGCGESFTGLNKHGQKLCLFTNDAQSAATKQMYKPVPFFFSSKGYGMFLHTSSPASFDFGETYRGVSTLYAGDDVLDLFIFVGSPQEILNSYTNVTGRTPNPPIWSYGLWMSRLSYTSQVEVEEVANKLRELKIPSDVIHIDAGWFNDGFNCDYEFSEAFPNPRQMTQKLNEQGFKVSVWQLPYFTPKNKLYSEIISEGIQVRVGNNGIPSEDAVLDFSNPKAKAWYAKKIQRLIDVGISVVKADFGEGAPYDGMYASKLSGHFEHNLYPLRYTSYLHELVKSKNKDTMIWARSSWAGGQKYPVHWGGDPEVSDFAMASTLRAGLSLGLSGFSLWSHDIGGFSGKPDPELFLRWAFFGMLSSHSRVHGLPPREPWFFDDDFINSFRKIVEFKYQLLPYIHTQASLSCTHGLPLIRPLFIHYPDDPTTWTIEDQYLLGDALLVAPLFKSNTNSRKVYIPEGVWFDYQTNLKYSGPGWHEINSSELPGILLVKSGSVLTHIEIHQSIQEVNWNTLILTCYSDNETTLTCKYIHPETQLTETIHVVKDERENWFNPAKTMYDYTIETSFDRSQKYLK